VNATLLEASEKIEKSGELFTKIGLLFKEAETAESISDRIKEASGIFLDLAGLEEDAFTGLARGT